MGKGDPIQQSPCGAGLVTGVVALHGLQGTREGGPTAMKEARDHPDAVTGRDTEVPGRFFLQREPRLYLLPRPSLGTAQA